MFDLLLLLWLGFEFLEELVFDGKLHYFLLEDVDLLL